MWALRRASNSLRFRGLSAGISRAGAAKSEVSPAYLDSVPTIPELPQAVPVVSLFYYTVNARPNLNFFVGGHGLSTQAGAESSGSEDGLEDGFSDLEAPPTDNYVDESTTAVDGNEDELISEPELSDDENDKQNALELSDSEASEKNRTKKRVSSELFKAIIAAPGLSVHSVLDKWVEDGNDLGRDEISSAMLGLRKRRMYGRALQLSEWLEAKKCVEFVERDYASRVDLIAKIRGIAKAENYIEKIPKSFKGEVIYRTLLANCVASNNVKKAEEVFNKMKDLEFPISTFACNQLLLLYKRVDKKKIADVLLLMEKENVKASLFTFKILIDTKGLSNDINGMDQIIETMKAEGFEPDLDTQAIVARHYVSGGLKDKAEAILKEMEGGNLKEHRWACRLLLPLYAALGKADEVRKVWKVCESNPRLDEFTAAIEAWGRLGKVDEAEAAFNRMSTTWKKLSSRHYAALLKVYANNKMLTKGKELVKRMGDSGCKIGPLTWDALVKLYVGAGEVEKADSMLHKAAQQSQMKPMFSSYMAIMDQYSKRGDIHNAEKMFHRMRQAGYVARLRQYTSLLQTYIHAKAPAYGIRDRMRADNIFPTKAIAAQLIQVDAFRKTSVSDLLD